ncbi:hypothetical protein [Clostridium novyi]|uniref:Uncharacterized protein n=1 Tax=Clostridium novyi (strain NT) TaxID=386415 RepID=A0Q0U6_CLONN|nr:hypothetical protein [Clostridium novyi]ABK60959.1 hypothetical protein NT01CX_2175 [Clostridium novyi NT]
MEIQVKGILKKLSVTDDKVNVGRLEIANNKITEIKYQMATTWTQGFITFCTNNSGQNVEKLEDASLNKNSIMFYKGNNEKVEEVLKFFSEKVTLTDVTGIKKAEKVKPKSKDEDVVCCPKCGSTQITANKRGFSIGKALLLGGVGGFIGKDKIEITCLKCGYRWKAGKK